MGFKFVIINLFLMNNDVMDVNVYSELSKRLNESEKSHKVFGFSHIIVIDSITNIMDTSFRTVIDGMFRRTKLHCKTDEEAELYRQNLCKLYLSYIQRGLTNIDSLEPKLSKILTVEEKNYIENKDRLSSMRTKVAEQTKRVQSLLALQSRLKSNTVLAEWIISKVEPTVYEAEKDLANIQSESQDDIESILNNLNHIKNSFQSFKLN